MKNYNDEFIWIDHTMSIIYVINRVNKAEVVIRRPQVCWEKEYTVYEDYIDSVSLESLERELSLRECYPDECYSMMLAGYDEEDLRDAIERHKSGDIKCQVFTEEKAAVNAALSMLGYPTLNTMKRRARERAKVKGE